MIVIERPRLPALTAVRFLAALHVCIFHMYADRGTPAREFWWARFARIYPAYLFSLLITAPFFFYVCLKMRPAPIPFLVWPQNHLVTSCLLAVPLIQSWV